MSAACGFRVFVPLLMVSIAARAGHVDLASGFEWIESYPALIAFSLATALEVGAYYVPWLDNFLDSMTTPVAISAGAILTASLVADMSPLLRWTLAVVAGGGAAGLVQSMTVFARGASTLSTGGLGNPLVATAELGGAVATSLVALIAPVVAIMLLIGLVGFAAARVAPRLSKARARKPD